MKIRHTRKDEIDEIMGIYALGRKIMRDSGNTKQWVGYPTREMILSDIGNGNSYVLEDGNRIHAVFSLIAGEDPTYKEIYEGEWLNDSAYMTIHRIVSAGGIKRASDICYDWSLEKTDNIRIDTHEDNQIMQHVLERNGFVKCGVIYIEDGSPRLAYHKVKKCRP